MSDPNADNLEIIKGMQGDIVELQRKTEIIQRNTEIIQHNTEIIQRNTEGIRLNGKGIDSIVEFLKEDRERTDRRFDELADLIREQARRIDLTVEIWGDEKRGLGEGISGNRERIEHLENRMGA